MRHPLPRNTCADLADLVARHDATLELQLASMGPVACDAPLPWSSAITDDELDAMARELSSIVPGAVRGDVQ